jgi:hypothetical protein
MLVRVHVHQVRMPCEPPDKAKENAMRDTYNGMAAADLLDVAWKKSQRSNSQGACVELAELPAGEVAVRNSRFPSGSALIYTRAEIDAFILGAKDGDFDYLLG